MIQIQNVTFFPKKNMILISRGLKQVWVSQIQGGSVVVKMKGFDRYYYDPDNREVYSKRSGSNFLPVKVQKDEAKDYWYLWKNGVRKKVYHWEILKDNMPGIELFINERLSKKPDLRIV